MMEAENDDLHSNKWGVIAITSVIFDIDVGQRIETIYPETAAISTEAKQSIAYLALPHSNKHEEGDTQFSFRFKMKNDETSNTSFYYGFVLFRQQKDSTKNRGYFQKSLVVITELPFVALYDRVLRIVGPLYFQVGNPLLHALYENIAQWPGPIADSTMVLPVAGSYVTFVVPSIITYGDSSHYSKRWTSEQESFDVEIGDVIDEGEDDAENELSAGIIRNGKFCLEYDNDSIPTPSFADLLNSNELGMSFEARFESCLWDLWQLAITGESVLIASPNSRVCSQAVLAFTSLLAPVAFRGDFRPYFTLYEEDFNVLTAAMESNQLQATVLGTTNPFFLKSLKKWPNALIFPFNDSTPPTALGEDTPSMNDEINPSPLKKIKRNMNLDSFSDTESPRLITRSARLVVPDKAILRQLAEPSARLPNSTTGDKLSPGDELPHVSINNALLRKHFKHLTQQFLKPFEEYFGIWSNHQHAPPTPYMDITAYMKPFHAKEFLSSLSTRSFKFPFALRTTRSKVKLLYARFIASVHFQPWFTHRRNECIKEFDTMLRGFRETITSRELMKKSSGNTMDVSACKTLLEQASYEAMIKRAIELEQGKEVTDAVHIKIMENHMKDVEEIIHSGKI